MIAIPSSFPTSFLSFGLLSICEFVDYKSSIDLESSFYSSITSTLTLTLQSSFISFLTFTLIFYFLHLSLELLHMELKIFKKS
jgi:hypothetical protein